MDAFRFVVSANNQVRLQAAARWVEERPNLSEVLVLAPSRGAADDFLREIASRRGGTWGVHRMTLAQLASVFATESLAEQQRAPLGPLGVEALAARAVHDCRKRRPLEYFEPVADMPGFARALARTLLELRLDEARPQGLAGSGLPGRDLARLLECYEEELKQRRLADFAAMLKTAVEAGQSASQEASTLQSMPTLMLDLSPTSSLERKFLALHCRRSRQVFACALRSDEDARTALEQVLDRPAEDLEGASPEASPQDAPHPGEDELDSVRRWVFWPGEIPPPSGNRGNVEFFSAPGEGRECVEIARRILSAVEQGVAFDQIAVLLRHPGDYLPLVEDALRRAGIPAYFTQGAIRPDPAGRAFLALLACAAEGLSASRFAEYLSLGQVPELDEKGEPPQREAPWVPPQQGQLAFVTAEPGAIESSHESPPSAVSPGESAGRGPRRTSEDQDASQTAVIAGGLRTPFQWEKLLTDAAVIGGDWKRWRRRLAGLAAEMERRRQALRGDDDTHAQHLTRELERLEILRRFALPLIRHLSEMPVEARWGVWLQHLRKLAGEALAAPDAVLGVLSELEPMDEVGPVDLSEVRLVLSERLTTLRLDPPQRRYGKVFVGTVEEASARTFKWTFITGLAEGAFPRKALEDPLLLDDYRERVSSSLELQADRFERERLLLRIALGSAGEKLLISYPRMDAVQGRPRVPSFYALDVLRAARGHLPDVHKLEQQAASAVKTYLGWPAPKDPMDAIDEAEYDLSVLETLMKEDQPPAGGARYLIEVNPYLARSLRYRWMRWSNRWSEADGLYQPDSETARLLAAQRLDKRSYSPTALQHFAACPYRFLLSAIHRLRPRDDMSALEQIDPLTRGSLFHDTQFMLFQRLKKDGLLPMREEVHQKILDRADETLNQVAEEYREELAPAIPRVWSAEIEDVRTDLRGWIRSVIQDSGGWKPIHFEFAFGLADRRLADPSSTPEEALVLDGYRLRGSIDLVEQSSFTGSLRVVDHKTGRAPFPAPRQVGGGEYLQPVLYALAAEEVLQRDVDAGHLFYCTQRGGYRSLAVSLNDESRSAIRKVLSTIDNQIKNGFLTAAPREDACKYCDFRSVCGPYEERRVGNKLPQPLAPLKQVRTLP
ncbi:MAG TPA: PD-(D/E)XK nuclease family protein [Acidobacteriota bacterium]|nr:PD-(D/E)XK nuclease family protein [Acidobacteriota bacterium]